MRNLRRLVPATLALSFGLLSVSCRLITHRTIRRNGKIATPAQILVTASRDDLVARISRIYNAIQSFQATVAMTPSVGSVYVLFRKPADIRIIAQLPVVGTRAFDMVSNGRNFKFFLVSKNLFVEGS